MKVPRFMKNEQTPKKCSNVTSTKLINTFKTIYFTPDEVTKTPIYKSNQNSTTLKASAKLNVSVNASSVTASRNNYTKVSQPKRLKRNRLLVNTKFNISKNETPVKAYLNAKKQQKKDVSDDDDLDDDYEYNNNNVS